MPPAPRPRAAGAACGASAWHASRRRARKSPRSTGAGGRPAAAGVPAGTVHRPAAGHRRRGSAPQLFAFRCQQRPRIPHQRQARGGWTGLNYLHDRVAEGDRLDSVSAGWRISSLRDSDKPLVLITAGVGITPGPGHVAGSAAAGAADPLHPLRPAWRRACLPRLDRRRVGAARAGRALLLLQRTARRRQCRRRGIAEPRETGRLVAAERDRTPTSSDPGLSWRRSSATWPTSAYPRSNATTSSSVRPPRWTPEATGRREVPPFFGKRRSR